MIRKLAVVVVLSFAAIAPAVAKDVKIGVIDVQKAIMDTAMAKNMRDQFVKDFTADEEKARKIQVDLKALEEKVKKSGVAPSKADQDTFRSKNQNRADIVNKIKQAEQDRLQELRSAVAPKLKDVMKDIATKGDYTTIIDKAAVPFYDEADDVTQQATEKLNQALK